eukprot:gene2866-4496_t
MLAPRAKEEWPQPDACGHTALFMARAAHVIDHLVEAG